MRSVRFMLAEGAKFSFSLKFWTEFNKPIDFPIESQVIITMRDNKSFFMPEVEND